MVSKKFLLVILITPILTAMLALFYIENFIIFDSYEVNMDVKVIEGQIIGVNVDTDGVHFGKVPRGGEGLRYITLTNNDSKPHFINIKSFGNISRFVYVSKNNFIMMPKTQENITVMAKIPPEAETGFYSGVLKVTFQNIIFG